MRMAGQEVESCLSRRKTSEVGKHFKNLLCNPPEFKDKPNKEVIHDQLDTKLEYFAEDKFDTILKTFKSRKVAGLETSPDVWKTRK